MQKPPVLFDLFERHTARGAPGEVGASVFLAPRRAQVEVRGARLAAIDQQLELPDAQAIAVAGSADVVLHPVPSEKVRRPVERQPRGVRGRAVSYRTERTGVTHGKGLENLP